MQSLSQKATVAGTESGLGEEVKGKGAGGK